MKMKQTYKVVAVLLALSAFQSLTARSVFAQSQGGDPFGYVSSAESFLPDTEVDSFARPERKVEALPGDSTEGLYTDQQMRDFAFASQDTSLERIRILLNDVLKNSPFGKNAAFIQEVPSIIFDSHARFYGPEYLMRTVLLQALDLTYGHPQLDAHGNISIGKPGVIGKLAIVNDPRYAQERDRMMALIMQDSLEMAKDYYVSDRFAAQQGNLGFQPVMKLELERLKWARKAWLSKYAQDSLEYYDLSKAILFQWYHLAADKKNKSRNLIASEFRRVHNFLKKLPSRDQLFPVSNGFVTPNEAMRRLRQSWAFQMNHIIKEVIDSMEVGQRLARERAAQQAADQQAAQTDDDRL